MADKYTNTQIHKYINTQTRKYTNTLNVTAVPPSISSQRSSEMAAARLEMYPVCLRVPDALYSRRAILRLEHMSGLQAQFGFPEFGL